MMRQTPALEVGATSPVRRWNIAVGNFFFRYRNALFPVFFVSAVLLGRPRIIFGNVVLDAWLVMCGVLVALTGQCVRLFTIGFEYIERGGKQGKVYASHLVQGGVYALTRNPMYVGNGLIAIGITMVAGSPFIYFAVLPFFLCVYQAMIAAEEVYLRTQFGAEYDDYCARVSRFVPSFRRIPNALAGLQYDWKRAVRKELSTITGLLLGLILLPLWRCLWWGGWPSVELAVPGVAGAVAGVLLLYAVCVHFKRQRRIFY